VAASRPTAPFPATTAVASDLTLAASAADQQAAIDAITMLESLWPST
jgi:hypothetical protein